jgi:hypothetical protein
MGICVFLYKQKLQRVDAGEIAPSTISPSPSLISLEVTVPTTEPDEVEELVKQIAKAKKVADLKRQLAEALEEPTARSTWNPLSRN